MAVLPVLVGCQTKISDRDLVVIDLAEVRKLHASKSARFVDPRSPEEFAAGHIPGALNLQLPQVTELKADIEPSIARSKFVVVYGNNPGTAVATALAKRLMTAGHKGVKLFSAGLDEWRNGNLPIEKSDPPAQ